MSLTHYETLGVARDASRGEITAAFRAQMRALHVDAGGNDELAKHVSSAYNVLSNASLRSKYDRTLVPQASAAASGPQPVPKTTRRRVFRPEHETHSTRILNVDPSQWDWYVPAAASSARGDVTTPRRRHIRTIMLVVGFVAWAAAGAAAATTLGLPLARIGAMSVPLALLCGLGAHLVWSALEVTRTAWTRWGLAILLGIAAAAEVGS